MSIFLLTEKTTQEQIQARHKEVDSLTESPFERANRLLKTLLSAGQVTEYDLTCLSAVSLSLSEFKKTNVSRADGPEEPLCKEQIDHVLQSLLWIHYYSTDWDKVKGETANG